MRIELYYTIKNISEERGSAKHIICYKDVPLYYPNQFLDSSGINSVQTRIAYSKVLVRFFNFIEDTYGIDDYRKVYNNEIFNSFMNSIIYDYVIDSSGNRKYFYDNQTKITPNTANTYLSRIQFFYLQLERPLLGLIDFDTDYIEIVLTHKRKNKYVNRQSTKEFGVY